MKAQAPATNNTQAQKSEPIAFRQSRLSYTVPSIDPKSDEGKVGDCVEKLGNISRCGIVVFALRELIRCQLEVCPSSFALGLAQSIDAVCEPQSMKASKAFQLGREQCDVSTYSLQQAALTSDARNP